MTVFTFKGLWGGAGHKKTRGWERGWAGSAEASTEAREWLMKRGYRRDLLEATKTGPIAKKIPHGREEAECRKEKK